MLQSGLQVRHSLGSVTPRRIAHARALQLEAIEQNSEILGNLDGMDRSVGARLCVRVFFRVCGSVLGGVLSPPPPCHTHTHNHLSSASLPLSVSAGRACVGPCASALAHSKLDQLILQVSKDGSKVAAIKAAKQESDKVLSL